ncbi:hypothetical protein HZP15_10210 [Elizabethkingia anophelis]|nr:hypothetical protein [Elizabethkingia anophelis]
MVLKFLKKRIARTYFYMSLLFCALSIFSCSSYSKYSSDNSIPKKSVIVNNDSYQKYTNEHFAITMLLFGDFMYAHEMKQYKKIQKDKSIKNMIPFATRNKILFGYTTYYNDPYLFENFIDISVGRKNKYPDGYYTKTLECNGKDKVTLVISNHTSEKDAKFLMDNFKCIK